VLPIRRARADADDSSDSTKSLDVEARDGAGGEYNAGVRTDRSTRRIP
jgi:hypothetical protein